MDFLSDEEFDTFTKLLKKFPSIVGDTFLKYDDKDDWKMGKLKVELKDGPKTFILPNWVIDEIHLQL